MLHKLVFDTTNSTTMAETHNVGAYLRAGADGALVGHQTIAASEWLQVVSATVDGSGNPISSTGGALDVNLKSPLTVDTSVKGIYDGATNATPDNVGLIANTRGASPDDTTQIQRLTAGAASGDAVVAANVHGLDTNAYNMLYNGTTWDRWQGTGGSANVNVTGGTITVTDVTLANTAIIATKTLLTTADTAQDAVASPLTARKYLFMYNNDNREMYVGGASVDAATGFPVPPGSMLEMRAGAAVPVTFVSPKINHDLRNLELS